MSSLAEVLKKVGPTVEKLLKQLPGPGTVPAPQPSPDRLPPISPPAVATRTKRDPKDCQKVLKFCDAMEAVEEILIGKGVPDSPSDLADYLKDQIFRDVEEFVVGVDKEEYVERIYDAMKEKLLSQARPRRVEEREGNFRI